MSLNLLKGPKAELIYDRCHALYGLDKECWCDLVLIEKKSALWLVNRQAMSFISHEHEMNLDTVGLRVFSGERFPYKPTLAFFLHFDSMIIKGFVHVDHDEARRFIHREDMDYPGGNLKGYYGVKCQGYYIGVGLGMGEKLVSQVPKKLSKQIARI